VAGSIGLAPQVSALSRTDRANSRLGIALIGAGSRGRSLLRECLRNRAAPGSQVVFYGTRGTLHCPFGRESKLVVSDQGASDRDRIAARKIEAQPPESHTRNWLDCIRAGTTKTNADIRAGYAHSLASILAVRSAREGRRLHFDQALRKIVTG
jgi:hypothetical protein